MKDAALRIAASAASAYFRHSPVSAGKALLWHDLVQRYIAWRPMHLIAHTRFGARMNATFPDAIQSFLYFFGVWEPVITEYVIQTLRPGDIFVDVGANVGYYSLLASRLVGSTGKVFAIEASPSIFAELEVNLAQNKAYNVTALNLAATAAPCTVPIYRAHDINIGATSIVPGHASRHGGRLEAHIQGLPLDEIVDSQTLNGVRLIKIDVEGAEWLVLKGLSHTLNALSDQAEIIIEINRSAVAELGGSIVEFVSIFREAGFIPFEIDNRYGIANYIATPPLKLSPLLDLEFAQKDVVFRRA